MAIDGFRGEQTGAFEAYSARTAAGFCAGLERLGRALHVVVEGLERIPPGPSLLVANHAFGYDIAFAVAAVQARLARRVFMLGEHLWWQVPFVRRFVAAIGVVDGTQENLDRLLAAGELVLVLPGGLREAVKPRELRYQLLWGQRYGFVRAALRHRAPLVPLASIGADGLFDFVGNPYTRGQRWLGRNLPIPLPARILPIPHLTPLRFVFGEPIVPPEGADPNDESTVRRVRREVEGALHELIENELARRAGITL